MKNVLLKLHPSNLFYTMILLLLFTACKKENTIEADNSNRNEKGYLYQQQADSLLSAGKLDEAFTLFLKSNLQFEGQQLTKSITYNNLRLATIYILIGDPNSAQELITGELETIEQNDITLQAYIYNTLAHSYAKLEDYNSAINNYKLAATIISESKEKAIVMNNIGACYIYLNEYKEATDILQTIINEEQLLDQPLHQARVLNNLGTALFKKDTIQGLKELQLSLSIRLQHPNDLDLFKSYSALSEYYLLNRDKSTGSRYAIKAYEIAKKSQNKSDKLTAIEHLIQNNANNATELFNEYIDLSKFISSENQKSKNQYAKIRYDFKQHEQENNRLKLDLKQSELLSARRQNAFLISVIIFLSGVVATSYLYKKTKRRHRKEKLQQAYLTETKIAKKIHDELANDVFNTLTYTQNFNLSNPENKGSLINDLESIYKKARDISLQHSSIATDETFSHYLSNLFNEYSTVQCQIIITGLEQINFSALDENQKITIYRVIQELLVNMKKHSMATLVVFKFKEDTNNIHLFYSDNGVGIIHENIISKNGLSNVENRIKNIGGSFTFDETNKTGIKYNIILPKKDYV